MVIEIYAKAGNGFYYFTALCGSDEEYSIPIDELWFVDSFRDYIE